MISPFVWSESEDHRIFQAGRDLRGSAVHPLAQNRDSSEASLGCSGFIQGFFIKNPQEHRLLELFGETPRMSKLFPYFQSGLFLFQHMPSAVLPAMHLCGGDTSLMSPRHQFTDLLQSCVLSRLPAPSAPHCRADHPGGPLMSLLHF